MEHGCQPPLAEALARKAKQGKLPKAVILVHLYGQSADIDPILEVCNRYGAPLTEDAAEALGATDKGRSPGVFGKAGIFSYLLNIPGRRSPAFVKSRTSLTQPPIC